MGQVAIDEKGLLGQISFVEKNKSIITFISTKSELIVLSKLSQHFSYENHSGLPAILVSCLSTVLK